MEKNEEIIFIARCVCRPGIDCRLGDLKIPHPKRRQFGEGVVDALDRILSAVERRRNRYGESRQIRGPLGKRIVHGTFLGVNGGRYKEAAQGICRKSANYLVGEPAAQVALDANGSAYNVVMGDYVLEQLYAKAAAAYAAGNRAAAAAHSRDLLARDPGHADAAILLAAIAIDEGRPAESVAALDRVR